MANPLLPLLLLAAVASASAKACNAPDLTCLTSSTLCANSTVYKCAAGMTCMDGYACEPKKDEGYQCMMGRYKCIDTKTFCNGNLAQQCAKGTWCKDGNRALTPCRAKKPKHSCDAGDWTCLDTKVYCESGQMFTCPDGWTCVGFGPCVKKA